MGESFGSPPTLMEKIKKIHSGGNSKIWIVDDEKHGICLLKEIYHQPQLTTDGVYESYKIYSSLKNKSNIVKIYDYWREEETVYVVMEYLKGWSVIDKSNHKHALEIMRRLVRQGVIDWDFSFLNFMVSPDGRLKMIDIDRLVKTSTLPECPPKEQWILTWFGSRMIKILEQL